MFITGSPILKSVSPSLFTKSIQANGKSPAPRPENNNASLSNGNTIRSDIAKAMQIDNNTNSDLEKPKSIQIEGSESPSQDTKPIHIKETDSPSENAKTIQIEGSDSPSGNTKANQVDETGINSLIYPYERVKVNAKDPGKDIDIAKREVLYLLLLHF